MRTHLYTLIILFASQAAQTQNISYDQVFEELEKQSSKLQIRTDEIYVVDSIYCFDYDADLMEVVPRSRDYNLELTENGEVTERLQQVWNSTLNQWVNNLYVTDFLDADDNRIETIEESWDDSVNMDWINYLRTERTPNDEGLFTEILTQNWEIQTQSWVNNEHTEFFYDNQGNNSALRFKKWNTTSNAWENQFQIFNAFSNNNLASDLFQLWNTDNGAYEDANRSFHSYNSEGLKTKVNSEIWNIWIADPTWQRSSQQTFSYNLDNQQTQKLTEIWNNVDSIWLNQELILDTYTSDGFNDSTLTQFWTDTVWTDIFLTTRLFDTVGNMTQFEIFLFQDEEWNLLTICDFYWRNLNPTSTKETAKEIALKMANPMISGSPIEVNGLPEDKSLQLAIFDNWGRLNYLQNIDNEQVVKTPSELSNGFYNLVIFGENGFVFSKKLVFLK